MQNNYSCVTRNEVIKLYINKFQSSTAVYSEFNDLHRYLLFSTVIKKHNDHILLQKKWFRQLPERSFYGWFYWIFTQWIYQCFDSVISSPFQA